MASFHDRMPVILPAEHYDEWLDPRERDAKELLPLLQAYPASKMVAVPVSTRVNNVKNDDGGLFGTCREDYFVSRVKDIAPEGA